MSSPLSLMTCLSVDDCSCSIRIEPLQALTLPYSAPFALATLLEVFGGVVRLGSQTLWESDIAGPLKGDIEAHTGLSRVEAMSVLCSAAPSAAGLAARYVSFLGYRDIVGFTVPIAKRRNAHGLYVATRWWNHDRERIRAQQVLSEELDVWYAQNYKHEYEGGPPPSRVRPAATLVLKTTHPAWLAHMRLGMSWSGYSFDDESPSFP